MAPVTLLNYDEAGWDGVTLVSYQFRAADGRTVRGGGKASQDRAYYETLSVVYDPEDLDRYEEKPVFDEYSRVWMVVFFGVLVPCVVGLMISGPLHLVSALSDAPRREGARLRDP